MGSPLNPPKGDFDYVLLRISTNSRIVFIIKILFAPLSRTSPLGGLRGLGVGGEAFFPFEYLPLHHVLSFLPHTTNG
jgi:hypothetical protein